MSDITHALGELVRLLRLLSVGKSVRRSIPHTFTTASLTLSGVSGTPSSFDSDNLQNSSYPFALQRIATADSSSTSNWGLRVIDKTTSWPIVGYPNYLPNNLVRGSSYDGSSEIARLGELVGPTIMPGLGHIVGPNGGFSASASSVGTATVTSLSLSGVWILEW